MSPTSDIKYEIDHGPAYASLKFDLRANQQVLVEAGGMAAMDPCIHMKSKVRGGLMKGLKRMLGGESLFLSEFTAKGKPGQLFVSPGVPGDIQHYHIEADRSLFVQSSGFVAASPTVEIDSKFQGFKGFFSGESLFLLHVLGPGDLWFSSYGAILPIDVDGHYIVDTSFIVAFEDTLDYNIQILGGLKTALLGGEGLVCRFSGKGKVWIQSRGVYQLVRYLQPFRPVKS
ncbi:MAG: TIGR00266 family protein [Cyanobacteria bacterium P01_D01_bin.123]